MTEPTWKKQGFKSPIDYEIHLVKQKGFKSIYEYQKHLGLPKKYKKQRLCKSLQKLTSNVKDPESLFTDINFLREISGCKIPIKKYKKER